MTEKEFFILWSIDVLILGRMMGCWYTRKYILRRHK
jgi:hypothetical protein